MKKRVNAKMSIFWFSVAKTAIFAFLAPSWAHFPMPINTCSLDLLRGFNFERGRLSPRVFPLQCFVPFLGLDFFRFLLVLGLFCEDFGL